MNDKRRIFTYRCARINAYIYSYLKAKKISILLASSKLLDYLFDSYDHPDIVLLATSTYFRWLVTSTQAITQLMRLVGSLPNHAIFTGSAILTAGDYIFTYNGFQMSEKQYNAILRYERLPLGLLFENERTSELEAFLNYLELDGYTIAVDNDALAVPKQITKANVANSLYQLLFTNVDCYKIADLVDAAGQVASVCVDVYQQLLKGNETAAYKCCEILQNKANKVTRKQIIRLDKQKQQRELPGCVYDIYLYHPQYPVIYRTPYLVEEFGQNLESITFAACVCCIIEKSGFDTICNSVRDLDDIENDVLPVFKKDLLSKLVQKLPKQFHQTAQTSVNTLKLVIYNLQTDGTEQQYCRGITNISISLQVRHVCEAHADIITLIFGRSFVSTPSGFVQLDCVPPYQQQLFLQQQAHYSFNINGGIHALEIYNVRYKLANLRFGVRSAKQSNAVFSNVAFQTIFSTSQFEILLAIKYLREITISLRPRADSLAFKYQAYMSATQMADDIFFDLFLQGKSVVLATRNIANVQRLFGAFVSGLVYSLAAGYVEEVFVELDFDGASTFGEISKWYYDNRELAYYYHLAEIKLGGVDSHENMFDLKAIQQTMFENDIRGIFLRDQPNYGDKMVAKLQKSEREKVRAKVLLIVQYLPDFPYYQIQKLAGDYFSERGYRAIYYRLISACDLEDAIKSIPQLANEALAVVLAYFPFAFALMNALDAQYQVFQFQERPQLTANLLTTRKIDHFTSCGMLGTEFSPAYFVRDSRFLCDFRHQPLAIKTIGKQVFLNREMFQEEFAYFQQMAFSPEVSLVPRIIKLLSARFRAKPHLNVKTISEFFRNTEYAVASLQRLAQALQQAKSEEFLPEASIYITVGVVFIELFADGRFAADATRAGDEITIVINTLSFVESNAEFKALKSAAGGVKSALLSEFAVSEQVADTQGKLPTKEELQRMFENKPLPYGWIKDGETYVSWSGEFSTYRPDIAELEAQYLLYTK